ncbi:cobalamin-5'-phosphate synthase [Brevirhabdus pacifica]|nr:cobalamin-5'-phosphate synthase [Brevirhabdus pacifica]
MLLTRLPVPLDDAAFAATGPQGESTRGQGRLVWAFPLVGAIVALLALLPAGLAAWWGLAPGGVALLVLAGGVLLTGAMHEDGLADLADGFWGGWTRERRLEIMKDSRVGTYGVLALILSLLARWWALSTIFAGGAFWAPVLAAAVLSRAAMGVTMASLDHARADGLGQSFGRTPALPAAGGLGLAVVLALVVIGWAALPALIFGAAAALALALLAQAKIGGQTGDVLGAQQQVTEIAVLMVLASIL